MGRSIVFALRASGHAGNLGRLAESMRLEAAVPGTEPFLSDGFSHIDPTDVGLVGRLQLVGAI